MSLVIHYRIGDVQDCQGVSASEMTYIVSSGALYSTHSLTAAPSSSFLRSALAQLCQVARFERESTVYMLSPKKSGVFVRLPVFLFYVFI